MFLKRAFAVFAVVAWIGSGLSVYPLVRRNKTAVHLAHNEPGWTLGDRVQSVTLCVLTGPIIFTVAIIGEWNSPADW